MDFRENELSCKQNIGWVLGGVDYYPKKKLRAIADVVSRFYDQWDNGLFSDYLKRFELNPEKRVDELSAGMKVKFALALALSHRQNC
jgi:ABC-2 type transport system ATP-binding protein